MRTFRFDRLVRDKIVPAMERDGSVVVWRKLNDADYAVAIANKLEEELDELRNGVGKNREKDLKELADIAEVYETAWEILDRDVYYDLFESAMDELEKGIEMWEIEPDELLEVKTDKSIQSGAFKSRYYIETASVKEDNPHIKTYLNNPEKYPEIK